MGRSISVMIGKGSASHNSRTFIADNVDAERTKNNIEYCNEDLKQVYHEMFDTALEIYNAKQTRSDRIIPDYYEKIRTSKQEKLFHEVIFQIGNKDDMNAKDENGILSATILNEFMEHFEERNPKLKVFSAHLHMDEETPHLHIDFVPFTIGSKRGLETRVSLKQALAAQGFTGGTRKETEWNQWVQAEKEQLAKVMERYNVHWEQIGTHEKHLSVLEFEKKKRAEEVAELETVIESLAEKESEKLSEIEKAQSKLQALEKQDELIEHNMSKYETDKEWQLPEPAPLMSAKSYKEKKAKPLVDKLKNIVRSVISQFLKLSDDYKKLQQSMFGLQSRIYSLTDKLEKTQDENNLLKNIARDFACVRIFLGVDKTNEIIAEAKKQEEPVKSHTGSKRNYER